MYVSCIFFDLLNNISSEPLQISSYSSNTVFKNWFQCQSKCMYPNLFSHLRGFLYHSLNMKNFILWPSQGLAKFCLDCLYFRMNHGKTGLFNLGAEFALPSQFTINVSTDMRHHRVRLVFQDSPVHGGRKLRSEQGVQVILDPVHSVRLFDWWHPQYPFSLRAQLLLPVPEGSAELGQSISNQMPVWKGCLDCLSGQ